MNARQDRQQNRINQGVHSGQLTARETSHIEHNETAIHNEVRNYLEANGGHLTAAEHNHVEHQQNQESRQIYHDKHNAKTYVRTRPAQRAGKRVEQRVERRNRLKCSFHRRFYSSRPASPLSTCSPALK